MTAGANLSPAAARQGELWSTRAREWAELQEGGVRPAQEAVLDAAGVGPGTRLLDVGCGAAGADVIARSRGAEISGLDAAEEMLEVARDRIPDGDFRLGELRQLPWEPDSFDVVVGFNSFQYAEDPVAALREARRVVKPGGAVGIVVWGPPEQCEAVAHFKALGALMPPPPPGAPGPLAGEQQVAKWATEAGLAVEMDRLVDCPWAYPDLETALRALMSAGPVVNIAQQAGEAAVVDALRACLADFATADGGYVFHNRFRVLLTRA
jgi:SAM-dependent methyltransferase